MWRPVVILNLQNFDTFVMEPKSATAHQMSLKSDDSRLRYSNKTIFKMGAVRHLEFSKFGIFGHVTSV